MHTYRWRRERKCDTQRNQTQRSHWFYFYEWISLESCVCVTNTASTVYPNAWINYLYIFFSQYVYFQWYFSLVILLRSSFKSDKPKKMRNEKDMKKQISFTHRPFFFFVLFLVCVDLWKEICYQATCVSVCVVSA